MFGKKKLPMRKRARKKIFMDLAETAASTAGTNYYACYTFSNDFAKTEGKTRIIRIGCSFLTQLCMTILFVFNIVN